MIGTLLQLGIGGLLLVTGKKLYWLVVGLCGAAAGLFISVYFFHPENLVVRILIAVGFGAGFAILALVLQRIMISIAGFIAGGYLGIALMDTLQLVEPDWNWVVFLVGGLIGLLIVQLLFDLSLVIISSFAGSALIIRAIGLEGANGLIVLLVLILAGIVIQSVPNRSKSLPPPPPAS